MALAVANLHSETLNTHEWYLNMEFYFSSILAKIRDW